MRNRYRNLWHDTRNRESREFYEHDKPVFFEHRGVQVFKVHDGRWDYVLAGAAIEQRAGFDCARGKELIDRVLDGGELVSDKVAAHIRAQGFPAAKGYSEAA